MSLCHYVIMSLCQLCHYVSYVILSIMSVMSFISKFQIINGCTFLFPQRMDMASEKKSSGYGQGAAHQAETVQGWTPAAAYAA